MLHPHATNQALKIYLCRAMLHLLKHIVFGILPLLLNITWPHTCVCIKSILSSCLLKTDISFSYKVIGCISVKMNTRVLFLMFDFAVSAELVIRSFTEDLMSFPVRYMISWIILSKQLSSDKYNMSGTKETPCPQMVTWNISCWTNISTFESVATYSYTKMHS